MIRLALTLRQASHTGGHGGKLRPGNGLVGPEAPVGIALQDALLGHGRHGIVVPAAGLHIGKRRPRPLGGGQPKAQTQSQHQQADRCPERKGPSSPVVHLHRTLVPSVEAWKIKMYRHSITNPVYLCKQGMFPIGFSYAQWGNFLPKKQHPLSG